MTAIAHDEHAVRQAQTIEAEFVGGHRECRYSVVHLALWPEQSFKEAQLLHHAAYHTENLLQIGLKLNIGIVLCYEFWNSV